MSQVEHPQRHSKYQPHKRSLDGGSKNFAVHVVTPGGPSVKMQRRKPGQVILKKLGVNLLKTYNLINQKYYEAKELEKQKRRRKHSGYDDENHDYIIKSKEKLNDRYTVDRIIGKGSFGQVVRAYDEVEKEFVAIKIVKSKSAFFKQAQIEIGILKSLEDPDEDHNIVKLINTFVHHNHQCLVFELLSQNLYELLRDTKFYGVSLNLIRKFAKQLLKTLAYIRSHESGVIHCDLKPENILLRNSRHSAIKVIDFGSACFSDSKMYTYIQSRFYRSPEVLLGCPYSCSIDMWSLGCILVEMHTGKPIFNGSNESEQVAQQVATLGMPPVEMIEKGKKSGKYFSRASVTREYYQSMDLKEKEKARLARRKSDISKIIGVHTHGPNGIRRGEKIGHTVTDYSNFEDLIRQMLKYNPKERIEPEEALKHKFFTPCTDSTTLTDVYGLLSTPNSLRASRQEHKRDDSSSLTEPSMAESDDISMTEESITDSMAEEEAHPLTSTSAPPTIDTANYSTLFKHQDVKWIPDHFAFNKTSLTSSTHDKSSQVDYRDAE